MANQVSSDPVIEKDPNSVFSLAVDFVNTTDQNIFLTGKAGTGKTTFLKYIRKNCTKKMAVVAPTGVAAMNAGGVTIHSLFQLPLGGFIPTYSNYEMESAAIHDRKALFQHLKLNKTKRKLLQELELLIIDEVSMLRADLLDAIDAVLRNVRRDPDTPFGGIQLLFIGDLFQLPPVVRQDEWQVLSEYYEGLGFYYAYALQDIPPVYLELDKIYRQSEETFIGILNNVRNNQVQSDDFEILNDLYNPGFMPSKKGEYIILTTHNARANSINKEELDKLPGKLYQYKAEVQGDFNEYSVNAEPELGLKLDAQVMFIRNDKGESQRYYNGKIGIVSQINKEDIWVKFPEEDLEIKVEKETWKNIRYKLNEETDKVDEEVKGAFTQYPLRLAWAITIHKSQGLTFEKAIVDAGQSFAPGQVYVALSRLTSLEGLVLYSALNEACITSDPEAVRYTQAAQKNQALEMHLEEAQKEFIKKELIKVFDMNKLTSSAFEFLKNTKEKKVPNKDSSIDMAVQCYHTVNELFQVGNKFIRELQGLLSHSDHDKLYTRIEAAFGYFEEKLNKKLIEPLKQFDQEIKLKSGVKKYREELIRFLSILRVQHVQLQEAKVMAEGLKKGLTMEEIFHNRNSLKTKKLMTLEKETPTIKKNQKGDSVHVSLELFQQGKTIEEIMELRGLAKSTIESHLVRFAGKEIPLETFVDPQKAGQISSFARSKDGQTLTDIRNQLGDNFSFTEIRAVMYAEGLIS